MGEKPSKKNEPEGCHTCNKDSIFLIYNPIHLRDNGEFYWPLIFIRSVRASIQAWLATAKPSLP
jgi:hypothetical protein